MARKRQAVTIRHVAADAGVSLQTVSRVINEEVNVRPAMRDKVRASIERLGYVPSIAAQRMSGAHSYLILAINDRERTIAEWQSRQGQWVDQMLLGGMLTCASHGYRLLIELVDTRSAMVERELSAAIAALRPDGIVLTPPHSDNPQIVEMLAQSGITFARIGSRDTVWGPAVSMDDEASAREAATFLITQGHRRIGFIAGPDDYLLSARRVHGWRMALNDAGISTAELSMPGDFSYASGAKAATALLSRVDRPTAIIASNDQMTLATLDIARSMGLSVPDNLSLISFDDSPAVRYAQPAVTAIDQPTAALAAMAIEQIIAIRKGRPVSPDAIILPAKMIHRDSVAPAFDGG